VSVLLDTHVWIWWLTGQPELSATERAALDRQAATRPPLVSAISLWEAQMLNAKGRLRLTVAFSRWLAEASMPDVVEIAPLDVDVIVRLDALPGRFHGDPADRLIVTTALSRGVPLATHDKQIRRSRVTPCSGMTMRYAFVGDNRIHSVVARPLWTLDSRCATATGRNR
jgi:PIN domain nuclease of toxin-antitoxin system